MAWAALVLGPPMAEGNHGSAAAARARRGGGQADGHARLAPTPAPRLSPSGQPPRSPLPLPHFPARLVRPPDQGSAPAVRLDSLRRGPRAVLPSLGSNILVAQLPL
jgi:hypothetical protein